MQTKVEFQGPYTIVQISGRLDIDKTSLFKQACLKSLKGEKVIFSLEKLSFVGSTGIINFFQVLKEIHELNNRTCRVVGLNNDFKRIVHLAEFQSLEFYENIEIATQSFENPQIKALALEMPINLAHELIEEDVVDQSVESTTEVIALVAAAPDRNS